MPFVVSSIHSYNRIRSFLSNLVARPSLSNWTVNCPVTAAKAKINQTNMKFTVICITRGSVCSIADPNLDMNDVICIELLKTSAGLGFSLDGGKASIAGDKPLLVKRIFKGTTCMQWMLSQFSFCLCIVQTFQLLYSAFFWSMGRFCGSHLLPLTRPKWSLKEKMLLGMARDCIC